MAEPNPYAPPRSVTALTECYFYHTMDIPGVGTVDGQWDLRPGISRYLGDVSFRDKRVLEIGTASGFVCFAIEARGGSVVAVDLSEHESWDIVPYADADVAALAKDRRAVVRLVNNSFWFCHRAFGSRAQMVYSTAYQVPEVVGQVDVAVFGCVLLHLRDPWLALERVARFTRETIIVTDRPTSDDCDLAFLPDPQARQPWETWWTLSPRHVVRYLAVLGFRDPVVTFHDQLHFGQPIRLYTVVARRHVAPGTASSA
jgi:SAM-dependent methyltransferase